MFENLNKSPRISASPRGLMIAILRGVQVHYSAFTFDMTRKIFEKAGKSSPKTGSRAPHAEDAEAEAAVAAALVRFQMLHLDAKPHSPDVLKILNTPLGFKPN